MVTTWQLKYYSLSFFVKRIIHLKKLNAAKNGVAFMVKKSNISTSDFLLKSICRHSIYLCCGQYIKYDSIHVMSKLIWEVVRKRGTCHDMCGVSNIPPHESHLFPSHFAHAHTHTFAIKWCMMRMLTTLHRLIFNNPTSLKTAFWQRLLWCICDRTLSFFIGVEK